MRSLRVYALLLDIRYIEVAKIVMENCIPPGLADLYVSMRLIADVKPGCKINFGHARYDDSSSLFGRLSRTFSGENRDDMITHVAATTTDAIAALDQLRIDVAVNLYRRLDAMRAGLSVLGKTYDDGHEMRTTTILEAQGELIDNALARFREKHRDLFTQQDPQLLPQHQHQHQYEHQHQHWYDYHDPDKQEQDSSAPL